MDRNQNTIKNNKTQQSAGIIRGRFLSIDLTHCGWNKMGSVLQTTSSNDFCTENISILIQFRLVVVPHGPFDRISALAQVMVWHFWPSHRRTFASTGINEHYSDVIMSAMASQITSVSIVYSSVCSGADHRKHQSSASRVFVRGIHRWPVNSPHKGPVTRKVFPLMTSSWAHRGHLTSTNWLFIDSEKGFASVRQRGHYLNQCSRITNWTLGNKFHWNWNEKYNSFHKKKTIFENSVCKNVGHFVSPSIETVSVGGRSARPARMGIHPIWWRGHGNTKNLSNLQCCDV